MHEEQSGELAIIKVDKNTDGQLFMIETEFHDQPVISYEKYRHRILDPVDFSNPGMVEYCRSRPHKYPIEITKA